MYCFRARIHIIITPLHVLAFIMAAISTSLAGVKGTPSRTDWIRKDSQKDVDSSGKAVSTN